MTSILLVALIFALSPLSVQAEKKEQATGQAPPAPEVTVIKTVPRDTPVTIEFVGKTVRTQTNVIVGMINTYKAMGGGWVTLAEETANTVDFPPEEENPDDETSAGPDSKQSHK